MQPGSRIDLATLIGLAPLAHLRTRIKPAVLRGILITIHALHGQPVSYSRLARNCESSVASVFRGVNALRQVGICELRTNPGKSTSRGCSTHVTINEARLREVAEKGLRERLASARRPSVTNHVSGTLGGQHGEVQRATTIGG